MFVFTVFTDKVLNVFAAVLCSMDSGVTVISGLVNAVSF